MSMVVSELSRELVASPNKEVDTDPGKFAIFQISHKSNWKPGYLISSFFSKHSHQRGVCVKMGQADHGEKESIHSKNGVNGVSVQKREIC